MLIKVRDKNLGELKAYREETEEYIIEYTGTEEELQSQGIKYALVTKIPKEFTKYTPPPEPFVPPYTFIINNIISDDPNFISNLEKNEFTIKEGYSITADIEIQDKDGNLATSYIGTFRMPIVEENSNTRFVLVNVTGGKSTITIPFKTSGLWTISASKINEGLSDDQKISFDDIKIYVVL